MKSRIAIISSTILVAAAIVAAPIVFAQMHGRGMGQGMGHHGFGRGMGMGFDMLEHFSKVREELGLTDEQVGKIHTIFSDLHEQNAAFRDQMHGTMKDVAQILIANPNDVAAAKAKIDAQTAAENEMKTNALNAASKALAVLTPEQRTKLSTMLDEHFQQMESRRK